ncbi:glycosyltransferase family 2 protein [Vibrio splendidus]
MSLITVVVPSYNHALFLPSLFDKIESINVSCKVLIIDDCSSDNSREIIESYVLSSSKSVEYIVKSKNRGLVDSLLLSLKEVKTKYIYYISSDDLVEPCGFVEAFNYMLENENINFGIFGAYNSKNGKVIGDVYTDSHLRFFNLSEQRRKDEIFYNHPAPILIQSTIFKVEHLLDLKVFETSLKFDDYPLFIKLLQSDSVMGETFLFMPNIKISHYNHHESNTYNDYLKMYDMFLDVYNELAPEHLRMRSISMIWWQYTLRAVRDKNWVVLSKLIRKNRCWKSPFYFFLFIYLRVKNKCNVLR